MKCMSDDLNLKIIFNYLQEFKADFRESKADVDRRFAEQDRKIDDLKADQNRRFDEQEKKIDDLRGEQSRRFDELGDLIRVDKSRWQEVYDSRDAVVVRFNTSFAVRGVLFGMVGGGVVVGVSLLL